MKICIYGGSFNPPHLGHTAALRAVRAAIRPDLLLVIPDRIPPHKELTAGSPEPAERLLMTMQTSRAWRSLTWSCTAPARATRPTPCAS